MGYTETFMDNAIYGASDINGIIKKLSTQGISIEFEDILNDGVSYTPSDLNQLFAAIVSDGVTKDSCRVVLSGENINVSEGTIVFSDGSTITVDSSGVLLPVTAGAKNYVYAVSEPSLNRNSLKCGTSAPTGDYVMLAEVENGVVTDKRKFAASKFVAGYNMHEIFTMNKYYTVIRRSREWQLVDTISVKKSDYKKILYHNNGISYTRIEKIPIDVIWDLDTLTCGYGGQGLTDKIVARNNSGYELFVKFERNGLNIDVYAYTNIPVAVSDPVDVTLDVNFTIELC